MAFGVGRFVLATATVRVTVRTGGNITPKPFPELDTPSVTVTSAPGNTASIYISDSSSVSSATRREQTMVRLTAGQSFTFTGVPLGQMGYRNFAAGTGQAYIHAGGTPAIAVFSYYKQSSSS